MAKRRTKRRTHVGAANPESTAASTGHASVKDPKSMVIRIGAGEVGSNISQLAKDVRQVMEPGTASRLKERRANRLRDYVTMTGPLGVTHLLLFSKSDSGNTNLRVALAPRGPTLHFRVDKYSLCKDVRRAQRHPRGGGKESLAISRLSRPPFSNLSSLLSTPQKTPLRSIKRVLLLNREPAKDGDDGSFVINFRHYAITTKAVGVSKPLRRLDAAEKLLSKKARKGGLPNLGKLEDISDYMVGGENGDGYMTDATSGSEMDTDAEVEVLDNAPKKVLSQKARAALEASAKADEADDRVERRAVKMVELGPRMKLRLVKVEEGLSGGNVMWHEHIHKSKDEIKELEKRWEQRRTEKEKRRKEQKANVDKKKKERAANAANGTKKDGDDDEMDLDGNNSDLFDDMMDDDYDSEGLVGAADEAAKEDEWEEEDEEEDE
ncbi:Brix domain-containing protein [Apiospora saccharicola]